MDKKTCLIALWHRYQFWQIPQKYIDYLISSSPYINYIIAWNQSELMKKISDADILYCWEIQEKHLKLAKNLEWIQLASSGLDKRIPNNFFDQYNISLTNMKGVGASAIAEFVLGVIISINRGLWKAAIDSAVREWNREHFLRNMIYAKSLPETTVGILGFGSIGSKIYSILKPLGVNIKICSRNKTINNDFDNFYPLSQLNFFLNSLDYLIISLSLNDETRQLIGVKELQSMSINTFIINIAREEIIERSSLIKAIFERKIRGVLLDVLIHEPPTVYTLYPIKDNIVITPHIASLSKDFWKDSIDIFYKNINLFLSKSHKINEVISF